MTVPVHGLPPLLQPGMAVALVPPPLKRSRWHEVISVEEGPNGQLVELSDMGDIAAAEEASGSTILASVADLPADYARHDVDALLGREVIDETHGSLGSISEVLRGMANDVWVIEGPYGEVLVPVVEAFVPHVAASGAISVRVPEGTIGQEGE